MQHYKRLVDHFRKTHKLEHIRAILGWDQAAMMPSGGNLARADAMAELALILHEQSTRPELDDFFAAAAEEELSTAEHQSLKEMHRVWQQSMVLPARLVEAKSLAGAKCEHAWRSQRPANDWTGFKKNLKEVVELAREEAAIRAAATGCNRYDAMIDLYEPGMTTRELDRVFEEVKTWLPDMIGTVIERQRSQTVQRPQGPFPITRQKQLGLDVMALLGFDFSRGRLDVSAHPFCGGVPTDVRITTRYDLGDFMSALMGVIHETGHARYEQNLPEALAGLPVGQARSMGVHESQSLFFEMQLARSLEFMQQLAPLAARVFGGEGDPLFSAEHLCACVTRVERGFIRVDADEVTYPAHVILRYEIERALINGDIEVEQIPELWNQKMQDYLGLDTGGNYKDGCMQDIHWTDGSFGYFPSYTLGAMYAAQQFAAAESVLPGLKQQIAEGELGDLFAWLNQSIWQQGSIYSTPELITRATGEPLNAEHFRKHLQGRYLA
ncbi:carboxypeptidase M32 [Proteobacteria bacterium 005FR1]|nr:carboxypeptidase M32 [Proteobacteria bacterium 005FR1]